MSASRRPSGNKGLLDDEKLLQLKFRQMDLSAEVGVKTADLSLDEIVERISAVKRSDRDHKATALLAKSGGKVPYVPPGGWKMDPAKSLRIPSKTQKPIPLEKAKAMTTIDKYREMTKLRVWDGGFNLPPELDKELWRKQGGDTSGHRIFNLSRDDDKTCVRWKPGAYDKDLPQPTLDLLTLEYRELLKKHVITAPLRVRKDLKEMEKLAKTTTARELAARVSSDLAKLERSKEEVLAELASVVESESSSVFENRGARKQ